jgi:hypothetical protein
MACRKVLTNILQQGDRDSNQINKLLAVRL